MRANPGQCRLRSAGRHSAKQYHETPEDRLKRPSQLGVFMGYLLYSALGNAPRDSARHWMEVLPARECARLDPSLMT